MVQMLVRQAQHADSVVVAPVTLLAADASQVLAVEAIVGLELFLAKTDCSPRRGRQSQAQCLTTCLLTRPSQRGLHRMKPVALARRAPQARRWVRARL